MAKKITTSSPAKAVSAPAKIAAPAVAATTPVRNSAVPPKATAAPMKKSAPGYDQIAQRAYFIWQSGTGGSEYDNWTRAERELRGL
ncbi:MAG: hypothetical protein JWP03_5480 [Phycisphaerales bacterium]|nr:hypothetical protein [Phycisphaerales bacterium]